MTAKRFTRDEHTGYLYDNGEIVEDVMKLLNALNDENEELKKEILWWKYRCGEDISGDVE